MLIAGSQLLNPRLLNPELQKQIYPCNTAIAGLQTHRLRYGRTAAVYCRVSKRIGRHRRTRAKRLLSSFMMQKCQKSKHVSLSSVLLGCKTCSLTPDAPCGGGSWRGGGLPCRDPIDYHIAAAPASSVLLHPGSSTLTAICICSRSS